MIPFTSRAVCASAFKVVIVAELGVIVVEVLQVFSIIVQGRVQTLPVLVLKNDRGGNVLWRGELLWVRGRLSLCGSNSNTCERHHRPLSYASQRLSGWSLCTDADRCAIWHYLQLDCAKQRGERCPPKSLGNLLQVKWKCRALQKCDSFIDGVRSGERTEKACIAAVC